jgi:hypothetical protein
MATASSLNYSIIQAEESLMRDTLGIYTKGAIFWGNQTGTAKEDMTVMDALPGNYVITIVGCMTGSKTKVQSILTEIANWLNTNTLTPNNFKIGDYLTVSSIIRLNATYTSKEFSFKFADSNGKTYTITITPKIYPKAGQLISKECEGVDQWGIYTDGLGGQQRIQIKVNSTDCGYVPPEKAGIEKRRFCEEVDQWAEYTDGNYGTYTQLVKEKAAACGYVPPPPAGSLVDTVCVGTEKWGNFTDGNGGTRRELVDPESTDCGFVADPAAGELVSSYCQGVDLWGKYTDGAGGYDNKLISANSADCGGGNSSTGTLQRQYCNGSTLMGVYSTGTGGTVERAIEQNSAQCTGGGGGGTAINKLVPGVYIREMKYVGMLSVSYNPADTYISVTGFDTLAWPFTMGIGGVRGGYFTATSIQSGTMWPAQLQQGPDGNYYPTRDMGINGVKLLTSQVPASVINAFDCKFIIDASYGEDSGGA